VWYSLLVTANVVLSLLILSTMKILETRSYEMSSLTGPTRRDIPGDGIRHSHRSENFKSYTLNISEDHNQYSGMYLRKQFMIFLPNKHILK
jgi:hypothetical protein